MRVKWGAWSALGGAALAMTVVVAAPQRVSVEAAAAPASAAHAEVADRSAMYCSGVVTSDSVPADRYIISGDESNMRLTFSARDLVYVNRGSESGAKVGDRFMVIRAEHGDPLPYHWFKGQTELMRAMGTRYADLGWIRMEHVGPKVSTAEVEFACDYMQRGDLVVPYVERPAPALKARGKLDPFAPVDGKAAAGTLVSTKTFGQTLGPNGIAYVNLGSAQGLATGSYLRVWRYTGATPEVVPQETHSAYAMYGWGSAPERYAAEDLPREIVGEAVVLRATPHTATILITSVRRDIFLGDYVELEK